MLEDRDVAAYRAGQPDGIRAVYREYGRLVFAVTYRVLGDRTMAEEATQQTFVQAWKAAGSFDPGRELGPWLATIARRAAIDVHRRIASLARRARGRRGQRSLDDLPAARSRADLRRVGGAAAVDELPDDEREVVRLQHFEGLTHVEIAERLELPLGTVKSRSYRAHKRLAGGLGHLREVVR